MLRTKPPIRMKRGLKIAFSVLVWAGIVAYLIWAGRLGAHLHQAATVEELNIVVRDSGQVNIIHSADVLRWIKKAGLDPTGAHIDSVKLQAIDSTVASHDFVRSVKTAVGLGGTVTVIVEQRTPLLRVVTGNGYDFYYTADKHIVPAGYNSPHYVPVITGRFAIPFATSYSGPLNQDDKEAEKKSDKNYLFLSKLINFVKYIEDNDFWKAQIVQINVISGERAPNEYEIELIPRVGDHVVLLGSLDGYERKLAKLMAFYRKALPHEGWDRWNYIDLRYDGQVVCSKR